MIELSRVYKGFSGETRWTLMVVGPWVLAALIALGNHFFFAFLHNRDSSQYNQFWMSVLKNLWAMVAHSFIIFSAGRAFVAMAWSSLSGQCLPVKSVDSVLQLPSLVPALQIIFSPSIRSLHRPVYWSACLVAFAIVTIIPPAALGVRPMQPVPMQVQIPTVDLTLDPRLYSAMRDNWTYIRPSNQLRHFMRDAVTSDRIMAWDAPQSCRFGCTYNTSYYAPVLRCVDYTPGLLNSGLDARDIYRGRFNLTNNYLTFNLTAWPISNGTRQIDGIDTSPVGTRCAFYNGTYTATITFGRNLQRAAVTNRTIFSNDPLVGLPLGFANTSSCPFNSSWLASNPFDAPPCARTQLNTWALVDSFASSLSGTIITYPQSIGPRSRFANNALMPNLDYLFSVDEFSRSFDLAVWVEQRGLGNALESLFANATLSLTRDALAQNRVSVTHEARVIPYANRYVYQPSQLWAAYASALLATMGAAWAGWRARRGGNAPMEESGLARILATTRDESFRCVEGLSESEIDEVVVRYEQIQAGDETRMGFTVVSGWTRRSVSSEVEEDRLLKK